ncbi:MAG: chromosomal replication initiator DnaA [Brevundimonas sp.]|nr:MAG: chromosomal replication initiator DnaA [Brevundimonas sp.]
MRPTDVANQMRLPLRRGGVEAELDFVLGDGNRAAAGGLDGWPNAVAGPVMALCGPPGSGKSALALRWAERRGALVLEGAEAALVDPLELEGRSVLLDRAADADDESLFHLINLAMAGGALLLVSRRPPRDWITALPDLRSRLDAVPVLTLEEPDDAVLAAMLRRAFSERSIVPPYEVLEYLVRRIDRSWAAAQSVVERLDALHRPITRAAARAVLEG